MADVEDKIRSQIDYADGTFAFIRDIVSNIIVTENGIKKIYHEFILSPTYRTQKKWNLKEKKEQGFIERGVYAGFYRKKYEVVLCQELSHGPKAVWFLHCDWEGTPIDIFKGKLIEMKDIISGLKKENDGLRRWLTRLGYEYLKMAKDPTLYMEKNMGNWSKILNNMNIVVAPSNPNSGGGQESGGQ